MSQKLIDRSRDLLRLQSEGFEIEVIGDCLLVHSVPYVSSSRAIARGTLVVKLVLAGDIAVAPTDHLAYFQGDHPCNADGTILQGIQHVSNDFAITSDVVVNHTFSNKFVDRIHTDYFEKVSTYVSIISSQAEALDPAVTAKTFKLIVSQEHEGVFQYYDTNSSRAEINELSRLYENLKIAIVGLGGTGSYVLDLVSKTPVSEIHIFDGDKFLQHNAFRAPGAASKESLEEQKSKVNYLRETYAKMHNYIYAHDTFVTAENLGGLNEMNFVFICIDDGPAKLLITDHLISHGIDSIDLGIGLDLIDGALNGSTRMTVLKRGYTEKALKQIDFSQPLDGEYARNIQIAELNAFNASLAVIKWKKSLNFYHDLSNEYNSIYCIDVNELVND